MVEKCPDIADKQLIEEKKFDYSQDLQKERMVTINFRVEEVFQE